jgi:hypothetical protein
MKRDDPIEQLRDLDPAHRKELDALVAAVGNADRFLAAAPARAPRFWRPRLVLVSVAGLAAALVLAALATDPFSRSGTISAAQAKARVAAALDLAGGWHVTRVTAIGESTATTKPRFTGPVTEDVWHGPDGRLFVRTTIEGGSPTVCCSVTLYAGHERRTYVATRDIVYVRTFALAADRRDDERAALPPSAADLYRAAYRDGVVRLAGIEHRAGREVYRLAFDWLGSSYTLVFDADRRIPISSEARTPASAIGFPSAIPVSAKRVFITRIRYTAYERVSPGPLLDRRLRLPAGASKAKRLVIPPIVVPRPVQGASATRLARAIAAQTPGILPQTALFEDATYAIVHPLPRGGLAAVALIPNSGGKVTVTTFPLGSRRVLGNCISLVEIPHPGGEVNVARTGCTGGLASSWSRDLRTAMVAGTTAARRIDIRLANGTTIRAALRDGVYLAVLPARDARLPFSIVTTHRDGSVTSATTSIWTPLPAPTPG